MRTVTVIYSSHSPSIVDKITLVSDDDTRTSAELVAEHLTKRGYRVQTREITPDTIEEIANIKTDAIFNMVEWAGLDYKLGVRVVKLLEQSGRIFTGGNSENYLWSCKKLIMKQMFDKHSLPTPKWGVFDGSLHTPPDMTYPLLVKPSMEHCSIGITTDSLVQDANQLSAQAAHAWKQYHQPILIEEFMDGPEYQVFVVEQNGRPWVLPPCKSIYYDNGAPPLVTFEDNWIRQDAGNKISKVSAEAETTIMDLAQQAFVAMQCEGYVRLDIRTKHNVPYILEINVNPGLGWDAEEDVTISARAAGLEFGDLLQVILDAAEFRHRQPATYDTPTL